MSPTLEFVRVSVDSLKYQVANDHKTIVVLIVWNVILTLVVASGIIGRTNFKSE